MEALHLHERALSDAIASGVIRDGAHLLPEHLDQASGLGAYANSYEASLRSWIPPVAELNRPLASPAKPRELRSVQTAGDAPAHEVKCRGRVGHIQRYEISQQVFVFKVRTMVARRNGDEVEGWGGSKNDSGGTCS